MGDSGALLLGFVLAALSVQGLLKTAATVALFFPLLVLAVPIVDTTFVVARRLKHGQRVFEGDQAHLHHRFLRRGFSQPRAAVTIWAWCASLAAAALATRFIPFRAHGVWHTWPTSRAAAIALVALGFSIYVVYVLEIVKVANPYTPPRRRRGVRRRRDVLATRRRPASVRGTFVSEPRLGYARLDEGRQDVVEGLAEELDRMAGAGEHGALGAEALLEHVADRVERLAVRARDDELRERRRGELVERDLGRPTDSARPSASARPGAARGRARRAAAARSPRRGTRAGTPPARAGRSPRAPSTRARELVGRRIRRARPRARAARPPSASARAPGSAPRRRARSRRRTSARRGARPARGTARATPPRPRSRPRSTSGPGGKPRRFGIDQLEALGERPLGRPGGVAVDDAAVHEEDARTRHAAIVERARSRRVFAERRRSDVSQARGRSAILAAPMQAASPSSFEPAGAGGLLLAVLVALHRRRAPRRLGSPARRASAPCSAPSSASSAGSSPSTAAIEACSDVRHAVLHAAARAGAPAACARAAARSSSLALPVFLLAG